MKKLPWYSISKENNILMLVFHISLEMNNSVWKTGFEQHPVNKVLIHLLAN